MKFNRTWTESGVKMDRSMARVLDTARTRSKKESGRAGTKSQILYTSIKSSDLIQGKVFVSDG